MIIKKAKLQNIIREELVKVLLEKNEKDVQAFLEGRIDEAEFLKRLGRKAVPWLTAAAIGAGSLGGPSTAMAEPTPTPAVATAAIEVSQNMQSFLEKYPMAKNERHKELLSNLTQQKVSPLRKQVVDTHFKNFDSFARFIRSLEGMENEPKEKIMPAWKTYTHTISDFLSEVPVVAYHDDIDSVPPIYVQRNIPAFYDSELKKIFINPFFYQEGRKFAFEDFYEDIKEEYIHAAQFGAKEKLKFPVSQMQTRAAADMGIFLSGEDAGMSKEAYDYLTSSQEFHAKMFKLKSNLMKQDPTNFDDEGKLKKDVLLKLMQSPNPPEILRVLDPNKIDKVLEFFDMVAQADTQKTSQLA